MIELISSPWRGKWNELVAGVERALLVATPFIKLEEATRLVDCLSEQRSLDYIEVTVLTDFRTDSVLTNSLDVEALYVLGDRLPQSRVISVPRLHAKVYVADQTIAIVTSANLTPAGLDHNMEYGVVLSEEEHVKRILSDILNYARLGSQVPTHALAGLATLGRDLARQYEDVQRSTKSELRHRFNAKLREVTREFIATQVGRRTANAVFSEAILYLLARGPLATTELHPRIQRLLPDLCDDTVELIINGQRFGKKWKHHVRNAQQGLKRQGLIRFDGRRWARVGL